MRNFKPSLLVIAAALLAPAAAVGGIEAISTGGEDAVERLAEHTLPGLGEGRALPGRYVAVGQRRARAKQGDIHAVGRADQSPVGVTAGTVPATPAPAPELLPDPVPADPIVPVDPAPDPGPDPAPDPEPAPSPSPGPATDPSPPPVDVAPAEEPKPQPEPPAVAAGTPLGPASVPLVLGIDGGHSGWSSREIGYRVQLEAAVTRHEWDPTEPIDEQQDVVEVAAGTIHTRLHALLGGNELGDPAHYGDWVVAFVHRYGIGGSFWAEHPGLDASRYAVRTIELGNEPYFGEMSASEYADTVGPLLERISDLNLPVKVVLPAWVHGSDSSWIETLYERIPNLNSLFDAFAFHPYWYGHAPSAAGDDGPIERIVTLRERMDELGAGAKQIQLTEYGESTANCGGECVSEAEQAAHLEEMIEAVVSHPGWKVGLLSIFQLLDRGTNSSDRELQFGLLREDGSLKPSYPIVHAALQLYR